MRSRAIILDASTTTTGRLGDAPSPLATTLDGLLAPEAPYRGWLLERAQC